MESIFTFLTESIYGSFTFALFGSFLWGVASILLSPCHLSGIPLIIGFLKRGQENTSIKSTFTLSMVFSLGILVTIAIIGVITGLAGRMYGDLGEAGKIILPAFFIIFGFVILDVVKLPSFDGPDYTKYANKGLFSSFIIGILFGIGLGPCAFAFMAPMLGVVFQSSSESMFKGITLLSSFAIGHTITIAFAGTFIQHIEKYLTWSGKSNKSVILRKACGFFIIIAGVYNLLSNYNVI